jgi:hypothetical protein
VLVGAAPCATAPLPYIIPGIFPQRAPLDVGPSNILHAAADCRLIATCRIRRSERWARLFQRCQRRCCR